MKSEVVLSKMAIFGHPVHPMLIHFPVAALLGLIGTDIAYLISGDDFWARAGLWLAGVGVTGGWLSSGIGLLDLAIVEQIRRLVTAWCHAILAVMMLSLATLNWMLRLDDLGGHILPWGLYLSLFCGLLIAITSLLGGNLVYDQAIGVASEEIDKRRQRHEEIEELDT